MLPLVHTYQSPDPDTSSYFIYSYSYPALQPVPEISEQYLMRAKYEQISCGVLERLILLRTKYKN